MILYFRLKRSKMIRSYFHGFDIKFMVSIIFKSYGFNNLIIYNVHFINGRIHIIKKVKIMKTIQIIVILSLFVSACWSQTRFCFPLCQQCDGPTYSQCRGTNCRGGTSFLKGTVTGSNFECTKAPYTYYSTGAKWEPTAVSTDIPAPSPYTMGMTVNITL